MRRKATKLWAHLSFLHCRSGAGRVPQGRPKIAQHLSAGWEHVGTASPGGTTESPPQRLFRPSGTQFCRRDQPSTQVLGYSLAALRLRSSLPPPVGPPLCAASFGYQTPKPAGSDWGTRGRTSHFVLRRQSGSGDGAFARTGGVPSFPRELARKARSPGDRNFAAFPHARKRCRRCALPPQYKTPGGPPLRARGAGGFERSGGGRRYAPVRFLISFNCAASGLAV